jgi:rhamnose utilization protein RhaD (predicted bifunctional aldolase and dehydrogenase)
MKKTFWSTFGSAAKEAYEYVMRILSRAIEEVRRYLSFKQEYDISGWQVDPRA